MLKYEVPKLDAVDPAYRPFYEPTETGAFRLQITGYETAAELRESKRRETEAHKAAEARIRELEAAQSDSDYKFAEAQAAVAKVLAKLPESLRAPAHGSPEYTAALTAYEADYSGPYIAKVSEATAALQSQVDSMRADLEHARIERTAHELAAKLAHQGCAAVLVPHIRERLIGREENGVFVVGVKDAQSLEALAEQLRAAPEFSRVIVGASAEERAAHARRVAETLGQPAQKFRMVKLK